MLGGLIGGGESARRLAALAVRRRVDGPGRRGYRARPKPARRRQLQVVRVVEARPEVQRLVLRLGRQWIARHSHLLQQTFVNSFRSFIRVVVYFFIFFF